MPQKKQAAECPRPVKARRLNLDAAVNVFQPDDVVFIQVIAGLNFDKFDVAVGGVFDPVLSDKKLLDGVVHLSMISRERQVA